MVDRDVLRAKTAAVLHHIDRLRSRSPLAAEALADDEDLLSLVSMDLQQAIQACIDLAVHACADDALGVPSGPADAFGRLARAGYFAQDLAVRLTGAAGLCNLIVHRYADLDCARLVAIVERDLGDLEEFVAALARERS